jgi:hypothetical protein
MRNYTTIILSAASIILACSFFTLFTPDFAEGSDACVAKDFSQWLGHLASGRYSQAQAMIQSWRVADGCSCPHEKAACIKIPPGENLTGTPHYILSPMDLGDMLQTVAEWEKQARAMCDPLLGSDAIGLVARNACLQRKAEKLDGIITEAGRSHLPAVLMKSAKRLESEKASDIVEVEDIRPMDSPSTNSNIQRRAWKKAEQLALEICAMQKEIVETEERIERIKRQPSKLARNKTQNIQKEMNFVKRLKEAVARSKNEYRRMARRDFNSLRDCASKKLPAID